MKITSDILNIIKEKKERELVTLLENFTKTEVLSECAQYLDKRAYITIDTLGSIKRKKGSLALPVFAFLNDNEILAQEILSSSDIRERQNFDKIDRFSSLDIDKVKINFIKTLFNGNLEFSKKYGKELFLRDTNEFYRVVSNFSLIGSKSIKPLMVLALKKLMTTYDENIFHLFISYMTKNRDNTCVYEIVEELETTTEELKTLLKSNMELLNSYEGLALTSALTLIDNMQPDNKGRVLGKIKFEIENTKLYTPLNKVEKNLLEIFL